MGHKRGLSYRDRKNKKHKHHCKNDASELILDSVIPPQPGCSTSVQSNQRSMSRTSSEILPLPSTDTNQTRDNLEPMHKSNETLIDARNISTNEWIERAITRVVLGNLSDQTSLDIGDLTDICTNCNAKHFLQERPSDGQHSKCCHKGKVSLPELNHYPELLHQLLTGEHAMSKHFLEYIRNYNSALAFASFGATLKTHGNGPYAFTIHGQIYHLSSNSLNPTENMPPQYAQLYILDSEQAVETRLKNPSNANCDKTLMLQLDKLIRSKNKYANGIKMLHEICQQEANPTDGQDYQIVNYSMRIIRQKKDDQRRFNPPSANEVSIVFENCDGEPPFNRDIRIHYRNSTATKQLSILDENVDPMVYPILFPSADQGWHEYLELTNGKRMSMLQFYAYRLSIRGTFNPILESGKLFQQFAVDSYTKIDGNRLNFIRLNQKQLRVESYKGLQDFVLTNDGSTKAGTPFILPATFVGSPRAMQQNFQDAMSLVSKFGKPDLFITMTCNPKWPEIIRNIPTYQTPNNRPDLIVRVFEIKRKLLMEDITKKCIFGKVKAYIYVIEFQKRGLPHMHCLIILEDAYKPKTAEHVDMIVSAEIPSVSEVELRKNVLQHMIHGPCGVLNQKSPCMTDGECTKNFPKSFSSCTLVNVNGYPQYKRSEEEFAIVRGKKVQSNFVVPYNRFLLQKYNCHINVEICASIKSIKYLFKYVYKGHDCASVEINKSDEITTYVDARYVSAPEALFRINEYKLHDISHAVYRLAVHLPEEHSVYFQHGEEESALERNARRHTTLTEWFNLNKTNLEARELLYTEIPQQFVFGQDKDKTWKPRKRGNVLSRMYTVNPREIERYYLRLLLLHVRGATSFENLKTVNGVCYTTFKDAAVALGLAKDDNEWDLALSETVVFRMPYQLRQFFAYICIYGNPVNPLQLWQKYKQDLLEDLLLKYDEDRSEAYGIHEMQDIFAINKQTFADFNLPQPLSPPTIAIDKVDSHTSNIVRFNSEQKYVFEKVLASVNNEEVADRLFFLDGIGGSGKTFLFNTLISYINYNDKNVCAVASTGIASTLLTNGRTYHSAFGFAVPFLNDSKSNIKPNSIQGKFLKSVSLIIWDEVTMAPFYALRALNSLLQDICDSEQPFAGKTLLLGGDFRQTLPIVKKGGRSECIALTIKKYHLWNKFIKIQLSSNLRASSDPEYSEWLIQVGEGKLNTKIHNNESIIIIPQEYITTGSIVDEIFGESLDTSSNVAILCPTNDDAELINLDILAKLKTPTKYYYSIDEVITDGENPTNQHFSTEFLNGLSIPGMPPHKLQLKVGAVAMLLRNLNTKKHLCNGTRVKLLDLQPNVILAEILTGVGKDTQFFLPRIDIIPSDPDIPVKLKRRQFPLRLSWAMTINKSQGQTFDKVGIYLPNPVFAHGQFYVSASRVKCRKSIRIKIVENNSQGYREGIYYTTNCVYTEVL